MDAAWQFYGRPRSDDGRCLIALIDAPMNQSGCRTALQRIAEAGFAMGSAFASQAWFPLGSSAATFSQGPGLKSAFEKKEQGGLVPALERLLRSAQTTTAAKEMSVRFQGLTRAA
jgi:hypothetical protein